MVSCYLGEVVICVFKVVPSHVLLCQMMDYYNLYQAMVKEDGIISFQLHPFTHFG